MRTAIIIPTYHERENLEKLVPEVFLRVPDVSVVVVDDNSSDGTGGLIDALKKEFPRLFLIVRTSNRGYGHSVLDGLRWALREGYDQAVTMDADFSHDFTQIPAMKTYASDFVVGSRYIPGGGIENWSWYRRLLSLFSNFYVRVILGVSIRDITTGFVLYNKVAFEKLVQVGPTSEGYAFLVESKYVLARAGLAVQEHPFVFRERREGKSKMSGKVIWESIWMPWQLRLGKRNN